MAETPIWFGIVFFGFVALVILVLLGASESGRREVTLSLISRCPKCGVEVSESAYFCPACGQRLLLTSKEEIEVSAAELDAKVEELTHQGDVRRIVIMDDLGDYVMETTVTPTGAETKRFSTLREFSPRHYIVIVERRYA